MLWFANTCLTDDLKAETQKEVNVFAFFFLFFLDHSFLPATLLKETYYAVILLSLSSQTSSLSFLPPSL